MSAQTSTTRRRGLLAHPCLPGAVWAATALASAVVVGLHAPLPGVVLGLFALLSLVAFAHGIAQGDQHVDPAGLARVRAILGELEVSEAVQVLVLERSPVGVGAIRGRRPRMLVATAFARDSDGALLRAAVALAVCELRSIQMARRGRRVRWALGVTCLLVGIALGAITPPEVPVWALLLAVTAPAVWVVAAVKAAATRGRRVVTAYAPGDDAAVALTGDPAAVRRALLALAQRRADFHAGLSGLERALNRCLQPIAPDLHESARASRLSA